jgi:hypothetical protein
LRTTPLEGELGAEHLASSLLLVVADKMNVKVNSSFQ